MTLQLHDVFLCIGMGRFHNQHHGFVDNLTSFVHNTAIDSPMAGIVAKRLAAGRPEHLFRYSYCLFSAQTDNADTAFALGGGNSTNRISLHNLTYSIIVKGQPQ